MLKFSYAASFGAFLPGNGKRANNDFMSISFGAGPAPRSKALPWVRRLFPLLILLTCLQAQAIDYVFPGNPPNGCLATSSNSAAAGIYSCGALTLGAGDTITVGFPTQITINGDFNTGASVKINANSPNASNLTFFVTGITTLGATNTVHANIYGRNATAGTITTGDQNTIIGNLSTGDNVNQDAGVINVGTNNTVTGNITTYAGAINIGDGSTINGNILVINAGAILLHINVTLNGNLSSTVKGSDSGAGAITVYGGSTVNGSVNTYTGAITVEVAPTGSAQTVITGNIGTFTGAITVATNVAVKGSVCVGSAGAITIGAGATIGGNVEVANNGAITIGTKATVAGDATTKDALTIAADAKVGTTRIGNNCAVGTPDPPRPPQVISRYWRQLFMR